MSVFLMYDERKTDSPLIIPCDCPDRQPLTLSRLLTGHLRVSDGPLGTTNRYLFTPWNPTLGVDKGDDVKIT